MFLNTHKAKYSLYPECISEIIHIFFFEIFFKNFNICIKYVLKNTLDVI